MKTYHLILGALVGGIASADAGETVRIGTLNCEWLSHETVHVKYGLPLFLDDWTPEDHARWTSYGSREKLFAAACEQVAALIARMDVDVLALQEVGPHADNEKVHEALQRLGGGYAHRVTGSHSFRQYVAVWSKHAPRDLVSPLPGRACYYTELDDDDSERTTAVSKGMHVLLDIDGHRIHFYCFHLKSEGGGHESDAKRVAQADIIRRHTLQFLDTARSGTPEQEFVIVAGDLNDGPGQPALRRIRGRDDIFEDLIQTWHTDYYHDHSKWPQRYSYDYQGSRNRIDHVLPSLNMMDILHDQYDDDTPYGISAEALDVVERLAGGHVATDHRPFIITLRFK